MPTTPPPTAAQTKPLAKPLAKPIPKILTPAEKAKAAKDAKREARMTELREQAKKFRPQIVIRPSDSGRYLSLAATFLQADDLEGAEAAAELATSCDESSGDAWIALGVARARQKKWELAAEAYEKAAALKPTEVGVWTDLGETYVSMSEFIKAAAALKQACELDPKAEHPAGRRARAVVGRTLAILRKG